jgi:hypothetical protein
MKTNKTTTKKTAKANRVTKTTKKPTARIGKSKRTATR